MTFEEYCFVADLQPSSHSCPAVVVTALGSSFLLEAEQCCWSTQSASSG